MKISVFTLTTLCIITFLHVTGQTISCKIWKTQDYSKFPDSLNIPNNYSCDHCTWNFLKDEQIKNLNSYVAVHLTFSGLLDTCFFLKNKFENISLIKKSNNKVLHPYALLWEGESESTSNIPGDYISKIQYMTNKFRVNNYKVNIVPKKKYDLIMMFNEAEIGDSLIVENFIKTLIIK